MRSITNWPLIVDVAIVWLAATVAIAAEPPAVDYVAGGAATNPGHWIARGGGGDAFVLGARDSRGEDRPVLVFEPSLLPGVTAAYQFDGVDDIATRPSFEGPASSTFEVWFKPADVVERGDQVIFETGDARRGLSLRLLGDRLRVVHGGGAASKPAIVQCDLDRDDDGQVDLSSRSWDELIQAAVIVDAAAREVRLMVNYVPQGMARLGDPDFFTGAGPAALGGVDGECGGGAVQGEPAPTFFKGQIAILRRYPYPWTVADARQRFDEVAVFDRRVADLTPGTFRQPKINVPQGFVVEVAAADPLVRYPMMAALDKRGRLFVAESAGVNAEGAELLRTLPHKMLMLEDADGDGRYDKSTVFADKMALPNGALWHRGALYVASPPGIWRLEDTDGDGRADRRDLITGGFYVNGMSSDLHGPVLGPDGRLYWCGGQNGFTLGGPDADVSFRKMAPGVFSCNSDGSDPRAHCRGGRANPVEVCFGSSGDMFGTLAILLGQPRRFDALLHWVHGGVYAMNPNHLAELPTTGDVLPPLSLLGQVAPAGIMRYRGMQFGAEYRDNLFFAEFNTHSIIRSQLVRQGSSYRSDDETFLSSPDTDTHFTDVLEDADGSLLVLDTGGWFRFGCPTSQIAKPSIYGAIYRVRRAGAAPIDDPRGANIAWDKATNRELCELLGNERPAVQDRAIETLALRGEPAIGALADCLAKSTDARARTHAAWSLARIESLQATAALRQALGDAEPDVRQAAARTLGARGDQASIPALIALASPVEPPQVRREAAAALGGMGAHAAAPHLLEAVRTAGDRFLEHALIYALIELNARQAAADALADADPRVRRAAFIALDRMPSGGLTRDQLAPLLDTSDAALIGAALDVLGRRPEWSSEMVRLLRTWLAEPALSAERAAMVRGAVAAFAPVSEVEQLVGQALSSDGTSRDVRLALLEAMTRVELALTPESWLEGLSRAIRSRDSELTRRAIAAVNSLSTDRCNDDLRLVARDQAVEPALRLAALGAATRHGVELSGAEFTFLVDQLRDAPDTFDRLTAATALGGARLSAERRAALLPHVAAAEALELAALVHAFESGGDVDEGRALAKALSQTRALTSLSGARLEHLFSKFPHAARAAARPLFDSLSYDPAAQAARLASLQHALAGGDPARGREVFFGARASCFACHRVADAGGNIGPDLTKIGQIRAPRDLLESIVVPSASLARDFETYTVATIDGRILSGVIGRETSDSLYLRTAERIEIRVARDAVDTIAPSAVSIMPEGLDRQLSEAELRDLLAFLSSLK